MVLDVGVLQIFTSINVGAVVTSAMDGRKFKR